MGVCEPCVCNVLLLGVWGWEVLLLIMVLLVQLGVKPGA